MKALNGLFYSEVFAEKSWISGRVAVRNSNIQGQGLFAKRLIPQGYLVINLGGSIFTLEEVKAGQADEDSITGLDEGLYLGQSALRQTPSKPIEDFLNHSCNPNLWLSGRTRLVARRAITQDEELTIDYATWEIDNDWRMSTRCNCLSPNCRQEITGRDWTIEAFQRQYSDHLLPCLSIRFSKITPSS